MRQTDIYRKNDFAGTLTEDGGEYRFCYDEEYLIREDAQPVSLTLPLQKEAFVSPVLFPFFDGLIPEKAGCLTWHFGIPISVFLTACRYYYYVARSASVLSVLYQSHKNRR